MWDWHFYVSHVHLGVCEFNGLIQVGKMVAHALEMGGQRSVQYHQPRMA